MKGVVFWRRWSQHKDDMFQLFLYPVSLYVWTEENTWGVPGPVLSVRYRPVNKTGAFCLHRELTVKILGMYSKPLVC